MILPENPFAQITTDNLAAPPMPDGLATYFAGACPRPGLTY